MRADAITRRLNADIEAPLCSPSQWNRSRKVDRCVKRWITLSRIKKLLHSARRVKLYRAIKASRREYFSVLF